MNICTFVAKSCIFLKKSGKGGGMKGRSERFWKFIHFGMQIRPLGNPVFALSPPDIDKCGEVCIWGSQAESHLGIWKNSAPSCWDQPDLFPLHTLSYTHEKLHCWISKSCSWTARGGFTQTRISKSTALCIGAAAGWGRHTVYPGLTMQWVPCCSPRSPVMQLPPQTWTFWRPSFQIHFASWTKTAKRQNYF